MVHVNSINYAQGTACERKAFFIETGRTTNNREQKADTIR